VLVEAGSRCHGHRRWLDQWSTEQHGDGSGLGFRKRHGVDCDCDSDPFRGRHPQRGAAWGHGCGSYDPWGALGILSAAWPVEQFDVPRSPRADSSG